MAENTTVNKVVINNETVIDITDTTATPESVADGEVFYKASGERAVGNRTFVTGVKGDSESAYRTGNVNITKANIGLGNVENKSSATIRSELTKSNVTTALGYTPYTPAEVDALVSAVFHYKGTKATYSEVAALTGMKVGDVWQVTEDNSEYVYNGTAWEKLGPTIDLSGYLTSVSVAGQSLTPGSNSITADQLKTALGLGSAAYAATASTVGNNSNLPTGAAVQSYVTGLGYTKNTGTVTKVSTGVGLTGGDVTTTGTIKAKLKSETASTLDSAAMGNTASRQYAVGVDKSGYLSVNVPWTDNNTTALDSMTGTLGVNHGGTGATTFTSGQALIGNGTNAITTRAIRNNTTNGSIGWTSGANSTALLTQNDIAYWNGRYNNTLSNLKYTSVGELKAAATYDVESTLANDSKLPTGAAVTAAINDAVDFGTVGSNQNPVYFDNGDPTPIAFTWGVDTDQNVQVAWDGDAPEIVIPTTSALAIDSGGTGATTAAGARTNLGLGSAATYNVVSSVNNDNNLVTGAAIKNYYEAVGIPSAICTTSAGTASKVATCSSFSLLANSYIQVIIANANSASTALTLNINGTGDKPIYINGSASYSGNKTLPAGSYFVFYDGTNYYFRTDGKITADITGNAATVNGHAVAKDVPSNAVFTDTTDLTQMTGTLPIANGGTGATTAAGARAALGFPNTFLVREITTAGTYTITFRASYTPAFIYGINASSRYAAIIQPGGGTPSIDKIFGSGTLPTVAAGTSTNQIKITFTTGVDTIVSGLISSITTS